MRFRTVGDMTLTGCVESPAATRRRDHRRDRRRPGHRARRDPWRRPVLRGRHGRPQEGGLLLMDLDLLRFATAGSVDDGKSTLIGRLLLDAKAIFEDQLEAVEATVGPRATTTPTSRCSPTGCAPSVSRASPSTSPTATSRRPPRKFIIADTPGPRAVHPQHGHRRLDRRPGPGARRRPPGPHRAVPPARGDPVACCGSRTWCSRSTRWTSSTTTRRSSTGSTRSSRRSRPS